MKAKKVTKKVTKKAVVSAIKSHNTTELFKLAHLTGVDTSKKYKVLEFARIYCITKRMNNTIYSIIYYGKPANKYVAPTKMLVHDAVNEMKHQLKNKGTNYFKVLVKGFNNWYWCSPIYLHSDYNKSIAFPINDYTSKLATLINNKLWK